MKKKSSYKMSDVLRGLIRLYMLRHEVDVPQMSRQLRVSTTTLRKFCLNDPPFGMQGKTYDALWSILSKDGMLDTIPLSKEKISQLEQEYSRRYEEYMATRDNGKVVGRPRNLDSFKTMF